MALLGNLIQQVAQQSNIDPRLFARMVQIESGNNPNPRTGSYYGLLQLKQSDYPGVNLADPEANLRAGAGTLAQNIAQFRNTYGRDPTPTEIYLQHQQGTGGLAMHLANPNQPAWQSMY